MRNLLYFKFLNRYGIVCRYRTYSDLMFLNLLVNNPTLDFTLVFSFVSLYLVVLK